MLSIKNNGAVVSLGKDSNEKAFIPGWAHRNLKFKGDFMTTTQGVELAIGDLITFCIDPSQPESKSYKCVGCNVTVLKHADYKGKGMGNSATLLPAGDASSSANTLPSREGSHIDGGNAKKGKKEKDKAKKANKEKTNAK